MGEAKRKKALYANLASRTCGECTLCCKVMEVPELPRPAESYCQHCAVGHGCQIYPDRPASCREWSCLWLDETSRHLFPADALRPDRCGFVMSMDVPQGVDPAEMAAYVATNGMQMSITVDSTRLGDPVTLELMNSATDTLLRHAMVNGVALHLGMSSNPGKCLSKVPPK